MYYYINNGLIAELPDTEAEETKEVSQYERVRKIQEVNDQEHVYYEREKIKKTVKHIETITDRWTKTPPPEVKKTQTISLSESGEWSILDKKVEEITAEMQEEFSRIDRETQAKIFEGFDHDNHTFSLSLSAQSNWAYLLTRYSVGPFPEEGVEISTKDGGAYTLTKEKAPEFFQAAATHKENALAEGRRRKAEVMAWYE